MTVQQQSIRSSATGSIADACPQPVSLETLAVVEQVLADLLSALRGRQATQATQAARDAGAVEYASWLPPRH